MSLKISRRALLRAGASAAVGLSITKSLRAGEASVESFEAQASSRANRFARAFAQLDEFVVRHLRETGAPGLTLALCDREGALRVATYGFADVKAGARVRPETLFEIGSISKSFVAVALLQLRDEGKIDFQKSVKEYLPWLNLDARYGAVTTHHLLTHTAGLPAVPLIAESASSHLRTWYAPGEHFVYSNVGYLILGLLIEEIDKRTLAESLRARVLAPLGMTASAPVITNDLRARMAVGYAPKFEDRPFALRGELAEAAWTEVGEAAGSIASNAPDMIDYMRMILNKGAGARGARLLSDESFRLFTKPAVKAPFRGEEAGYSYGLFVSETEGRTHLRHTGGMVAFSSMMDVDITTGLAAFASVNANLAGYRPVAVTKYALELLRASLASKPLPAPPAPLPLPEEIKDAADYAGAYTSADGKRLVLVGEANRLLLLHKGSRIALERSGGRDAFIIKHAEFERFRLVFGREGGAVVEAGHGADWFTNEKYRGARAFDYPKEWGAYVGRYRNDSPWYGSMRIVLRKGKLWIDGEQILTPAEDGTFRTSPLQHSPDRISFEAVMGGRAMRANYSGVEFYRTFTP